MYSMNGKKSVPEVASAIWSQSAIGEVRYRRFHCIYNYQKNKTILANMHLKRSMHLNLSCCTNQINQYNYSTHLTTKTLTVLLVFAIQSRLSNIQQITALMAHHKDVKLIEALKR